MSNNRFALVIVCAACACAPSLATDVPMEVKSEFRQNVVKRDHLIRQLVSIDSKAADAVVAGKAPVSLHAQQTELHRDHGCSLELGHPPAPEAGV